MDNITDMNKLQKYKIHYLYAKQYGDTDIQIYYLNKIIKLLQND